MSPSSEAADHATPLPPREIGRATGAVPGPQLLVVAGLHGNEPAGVRATERVISMLAGMTSRMQGDVVALRGNRRALAAGRRYLDRDLNRGWSKDYLASLRETNGSARTAEDLEQIELAESIEGARRAARGPATFLDLHTTSADGVPFSMTGDWPGVRELALQFPLPVIEGLLGQVNGVLLEYLAADGLRGFGVEGGQNDGPESIANHEAMLWLVLVECGILAPAAVPDLAGRRAHLEAMARSAPRLMRVHHRHGLWPQDEFQMEPGYANIQRVRAGDLLARDRHGEIRAPEEGVLLMPLYQALGDDGFFLGREVAAGG